MSSAGQWIDAAPPFGGKILGFHRVSGLPIDIPNYTWREAMLRAEAAAPSAEGRVSVRREDRSNGMCWVVRYRCNPVPMNAAS